MAHDDCKHEGELGTITSKLESIIHRLDKTEDKTDQNAADIQELKENKASTDEKFNRVFELLSDLKGSIDKIQKAIEVKNERLPNFIYSVTGMVLGGVLTGVVVWILTK